MPLTNIKVLKNELRAKHRRLRKSCPPKIKAELDFRLFERFTMLEEYKNCSVIFLFVSSEIEVDTGRIMQKAWDDGKRVALPRCRDKYGNMDFFFVSSRSQLAKGSYGIMEPIDECGLVTDFSDGVCVVPALCFDMFGYRLGFGKGYYDRFLERFGGVAVGLCYSKCIEHELPKNVHDKPVDILVTEKYVSRISKSD